MTSDAVIETLSDDNGKSLFRSQRIKVRGKEIVTPVKALDPSKFKVAIPLAENTFGLTEIYKEFDHTQLTKIQTDSQVHDTLSRDLANLQRKGHNESVSVCVLKYKSPTLTFPSSKEIELMTDIAHSYSDATPIPLLSIPIDTTNFSAYLDYVKACYSSIEELNEKPIIGTLPNVPREKYPELLTYYLEKGIRLFSFDFDGRTPDPLKMRPVLRFLKVQKVLDESAIYGINAKPGRLLKNAEILPAKDFIAYGYRIDMLGESHIGMRAPKAFFEKMKAAMQAQQVNKKRIFIKNDYGYYRTGSSADLSSVYPTDSKIKLDQILNDDTKSYQKLFNMEQQAIESVALRNRLASLDANESILRYIKEKAQMQSEIKQLEAGTKNLMKK